MWLILTCWYIFETVFFFFHFDHGLNKLVQFLVSNFLGDLFEGVSLFRIMSDRIDNTDKYRKLLIIFLLEFSHFSCRIYVKTEYSYATRCSSWNIYFLNRYTGSRKYLNTYYSVSIFYILYRTFWNCSCPVTKHNVVILMKLETNLKTHIELIHIRV